MLIALHASYFENNNDIANHVIEELQKFNVELCYHRYIAGFLNQRDVSINDSSVFSGYEDIPDVDIMISIGGDGTLLESLTIVRDKKIPVLGVNAGRLGFLSSISTEEIANSLQELVLNNYVLDERILICVESNESIFENTNFALNEITLLKGGTSSMITIHTYIDDVFLNSYWGDGIIISTPTGSTGYSLSVGGPIVMPGSRNFIISPVNPHNLTVRPLVISDNTVITLEPIGRDKNFLVSLDSRSEVVKSGVSLRIEKCVFTMSLVKFKNNNFLETLRLKLNWGYDRRN